MSNPAFSAAVIRSPLDSPARPNSGAVSTVWPIRWRRIPSGTFSSNRMRGMSLRQRIGDDAPRAVEREAWVDLRHDLLRRKSILGVIQDRLNGNTGAFDQQRPRHLAGNPLNVVVS